MRKIFITLVTLLCISCTAFLMTACEEDLSNSEQPKNEIQLVYDQYVSFSNENGYTPLSYEDFINIVKGDKEKVSVGIDCTEIDSDDNFLIKFKDKTIQSNVTQHIHSYSAWTAHSKTYGCVSKIYYRACSSCNSTEIKAEPNNKHDWKTEYEINNDKHYIECSICNVKKDEEAHKFNGGTKCTVCEYECAHGQLTHDASHHWIERNCSHLESNSPLYNKEKHNFNGGTKCTGCDYECSHYQYESDNTHHWIVDTCEHVANGEYSTEKQEHVFENNDFSKCVVCQKKMLLKTTLSVVSYDGGWGIEWLQSMADEFEEMYKDYSFEPDRLGVEIKIKPGKSDVTGNNLKDLMDDSTDFDVFFSTFALSQYIGEDKLLNITDLVNNTMNAKYKKVWSDLGETKTIAQKMDKTIKDYVLFANADGNGVVQQEAYYGIPMYSSFYNLVYDVDLFYEKGFYMDANKNFITGTKMGNTEEAIDAAKHAGQDGVKGTEDDGLPITWDDFYKLCDYIARSPDVVPLCWNDDYPSYRMNYLNNLWANYEGIDDWYINVIGEGNDSQFGQISPELENGYKLAGQKGRLAALKFAENIVKNNWYDTNASTGTNHTQAQTHFLMSKVYNSFMGSDSIAMLIDGSWWENEAKSTLENISLKYGISNRRFGIMTYPRMDDGHYVDVNGNNKMSLVLVNPDSNVAIKKNPKQKEAAELFLIFTSTTDNMRKYTRMTGSTRCYDYDLTEEDFAEMSYYKISVWNYFKRAMDSNNICFNRAPNLFGKNNKYIVESNYYFALTSEYTYYSADDPFSLFSKYPDLTAEDYFTSYKNYWTQSNYKSEFLNYL